MLSLAVKRGKEQGFDVVLCDTSGRKHNHFFVFFGAVSCVAHIWHNLRRDACFTCSGLHTNYSLMEELIACKKAVAKVVPGAPNV